MKASMRKFFIMAVVVGKMHMICILSKGKEESLKK
jgi:hypothetical protein